MNKNPHSIGLIWLAILVTGVLPVVMYQFVAPDGSGASAAKCAVLATRDMSTAEQALAVGAGFVVKPIYMLLSFIWIVWLWRRSEPDLTALRRGLIAFWLGENACTVNYLCFGGRSDLWEYLHNFGMAVGFSFSAWAVLDGVDRRVLKLSAPKERCAALNLCGRCIKYSAVPCKLQRVFKMLIPATLVAAMIPFTAGVKMVSYDSVVMGAAEHYALMVSSQWFENYYCPGIAIVLLTASWFVMLFKKDDPVPLAKVFFAASLGPLGFGFMRLFLSGVFADNLLWYVAWEEFTEWLFVVAVGYVLWVFRHTLFHGNGDQAALAIAVGTNDAMRSLAEGPEYRSPGLGGTDIVVVDKPMEVG